MFIYWFTSGWRLTTPTFVCRNVNPIPERRGRNLFISGWKNIGKVLWQQEQQQTKKITSRDELHNLYWSVCLSPSTHMIIQAMWDEMWEREKTRSSERGPSCDGAPHISSLAPQWLEQQFQRDRSGSHISCTLTHTHTHALFYLSGCCLLCIWLGFLCLSAYPPHKPNNATLLRLLRTWPAAQWKKRRRTPRGGRGKWGKEKVTHSHRGCYTEIWIWTSGLRGTESLLHATHALRKPPSLSKCLLRICTDSLWTPFQCAQIQTILQDSATEHEVLMLSLALVLHND